MGKEIEMKKIKSHFYVRTLLIVLMCLIMLALPISSISAGFSGSKAFAWSEDDHVTYWEDHPDFGGGPWYTDTDNGPYKVGDVAQIIEDYPYKPGLKFIGWARVNDEGGLYPDIYSRNVSFQIDNTNKFIAQYEPILYRVTYYADGGAFSNGEELYEDPFGDYRMGDLVTVYSEVPIKPGYTFGGWGYYGSIYHDGDTFYMPPENPIFIARWDMVHTCVWGIWAETTPPTCLANGIETRVCTIDSSHTETRSIAALGHAWGAWSVTTPATCLTAGAEQRTCLRTGCGLPDTRTTSPLGHDWGVWLVTTPATQTADGLETCLCKRDPAHVMTKPISKLTTTPPPVITTVDPPPPPRIIEPEIEPPEPLVQPVVETAVAPLQPSVEPAPAPPAVSEVKIEPLPVAEESPNAALVKELSDAGVPILTIGGQEVPLIAFPGMAAWALLNLILALIGIVIAIVSVFRIRSQRVHGIEGIETFYDEDEEEKAKRRHIWVLPLAVLAVFGIVFFMLTENMNNLIVLLWDQWTIVNAIAFAGVIIMARLAFKRKAEEEPDHDFSTWTSTVTE